MTTFEYVIKDEQGMHIRPAGLFAKEAKKFTSTITVERGDKKTDATKLMAVMGMGIKCGETITIAVDGEDEAEAVVAMRTFLEANL